MKYIVLNGRVVESINPNHYSDRGMAEAIQRSLRANPGAHVSNRAPKGKRRIASHKRMWN